ncbi:MAG: P-loop NTPase fold protein [Methylobacter sp.]|nr:P-loop NTPase fold protein [Methylobacter sp.]
MSNLPLSHNDTAKADDVFQQQAFIDQVCELIKNCQPPKGIGINGYWGTGKTSALMQIHKTLTGAAPHDYKKSNDQNIVPVWFEAWRYQSETIPIVALLQEIRAQLGMWQKLVHKGKKLTEIAVMGVLGAFDATLKTASGGIMAPNLGKIPELGKQWETEHRETPLASQDLLKLLEQAIDQALNKKEGDTAKRLVIFIDDLDRCLPKVALQLLEGIKVYLNLSNCVLVFGMDQRQIEEALSKALETKDTHQAREYLEKICQDIHHLPIPNKQVKAAYLLGLLKELDVDDRSQTTLTDTQKAALKNSHLTAIENVLLAYDCLPANPRKIKALSNRLALQLRKHCIHSLVLISQEQQNRLYMLLVAMAIIYNFHRQLNEQLEKNPEYINQVLIYAENPPASPTVIFEPMRDIIPSIDSQQKLPTNPSDSNVFRLHELFLGLGSVTVDELTCFLDSHL